MLFISFIKTECFEFFSVFFFLQRCAYLEELWGGWCELTLQVAAMAGIVYSPCSFWLLIFRGGILYVLEALLNRNLKLDYFNYIIPSKYIMINLILLWSDFEMLRFLFLGEEYINVAWKYFPQLKGEKRYWQYFLVVIKSWIYLIKLRKNYDKQGDFKKFMESGLTRLFWCKNIWKSRHIHFS